MSQRIDLYRDDLRPFESSGELNRNTAIVALAVLAMLIWGGMTQWRASTTGARVVELTAEQASLQQRMTTASEQLAQRVPDPVLTAALVQAQFGLDGRRWLVDQLDASGDEVVPFTSVLEGLGRQRPEPLWLTRIRVADAGAVLGLSGRTLQADHVPAYLQALAGEDGLRGREFTHFSIVRPEEGGGPLEFDMATSCTALAAGCAPGMEPETAP